MAKKYFELMLKQTDSNNILESMGISEERWKLLEKELVYELHTRNHDTVSKTLAYLTNQCESLEEVVYLVYSLGKHIGRAEFPCGIGAVIKRIVDDEGEE